jgi:hypothetical protein
MNESVAKRVAEAFGIRVGRDREGKFIWLTHEASGRAEPTEENAWFDACQEYGLMLEF